MKRFAEKLFDVVIRPVSGTAVFAWWRRTGRSHRRAHAVTALLLVISVIAQAVPVHATTCTTTGNDVTIASSCIFDAGTYTFTGTLTINAGVTVTAASNVGAGQVVIISDNIVVSGTISANGTGSAAEAGSGPGNNNSDVNAGSGGGYGGNGGAGGGGASNAGGSPYGSVTQPTDLGSGGGNDANDATSGGAGGGSIKLQLGGAGTGTITIAGTVSANGANAGGGDPGGGSGGSVWIDAPSGTVTGAGTITANGGGGTSANNGGGGSGGRVAIYYTGTAPTMTVQAFGGVKGTAGGSQQDGGAGTIYRKSAAQTNGDIIIDNNNRSLSANTTQVAPTTQTYDNVTVKRLAKYSIPSGFTFAIASGGTFTGGATNGSIATQSGSPNGVFDLGNATFTINQVDLVNNGTIGTVTDLTYTNGAFTLPYVSGATGSFGAGLAGFTIGTGATVTMTNTNTMAITTLTVQSGGTLTHSDNTSTRAAVVDVSATTISVNSGATVTADAKGFTAPNGTGVGGTGSFEGGGGGYGGKGGDGNNGTAGGAVYGSLTQPTDLGSAGGGDNNAGGNTVGGDGGGAIKLIASGTLTVAGTVTANGAAAVTDDAAGGAGGSIWLDGGTIAGTGTIRTNGGAANGGGNYGGGGAGGRIAVYYASGSPTSYTLQSFGGARGDGSGGTQLTGGAGTIYTKSSAATNGDLTVDNNEQSGADTEQFGTLDQIFDNVNIKKGARYRIPNLYRLRYAVAILGTGTTRPHLLTSFGGKFRPPGTSLVVSGFNFTNDGEAENVTDITVSNATITNGSGTFANGCNSLTIGSGGTFLFSGTSTFTACATVTVQSGGTITHSANSTARSHVIDLSATTIDVQTGGTVTADSLGFTQGNGPGFGTSSGAQGSGAGYGGNGAQGSSGTPGVTYGSVTNPTDIGSGGGSYGGQGGGAIKLSASGSLTIAGTVTANGGSGCCGGGGGSGGSVRLDAGTLFGAGIVRANGGTGNQSGGGGAGGRIAVYYATDSSTLVSGDKLNALGGANGANIGGAGSVFVDDTDDALANGTLIIDNNNQAGANTTQVTTTTQTYDSVIVRDGSKYVVPSGFTLTVPSTGTLSGAGTAQSRITVNSGGTLNLPATGTYTVTGLDITNNGTVNNVADLSLNDSTFTHNGAFGSTLTSITSQSTGNFILQTLTNVSLSTITAQSGGTFTQAMLGAVPATTVTVQSGGFLTHSANAATKVYELNLASTTIDVQTGGTVTADALGFTQGNGPGFGTSSGAQGSGAGYGGNGAQGSSGSPGVTYGSVTNPTDLGSGGGSYGGTGGGAITLNVTGTLTVAGTITTGGGSGCCGGGGGSGGSIRIDTDTLSGAGTVRANGGTGNQSGGGGAGGRVAVYYTTDSSTLISGSKVNAFGGANGANIGGAGTVYLKQASATNGDFIVDNNSQNGANTTQVAATSLTFDNITVKRGGKYVIPSGDTLAFVSTVSGSGSPQSIIIVNAGGTFSPPSSSFTLSGLDLTNNGTLGNVTSMTVGPTATFTEAQSATHGITSLTVGNSASGTFAQSGTGVISIPTVTVNSGGTMTHSTNTTTKAHELNISATTVTVNSGGTINVVGKGFNPGQGTGKGNGTAQGGGGGYGGEGGDTASAGGVTYGSVTQPVDLGSGGSNQGSNGHGGGAIKLIVSGTLTVDGTVNATGNNGDGTGAGGGSGGSIWIDADTLAGGATSPAILSNGGNATQSAASGGGGRIAIYYNMDSSTLISGDKVKAIAGTTNNDGGAGTVFIDDKNDALVNGSLLVDNDNANGEVTTQVAATSLTFDAVTVRDGAKYVIPGSSSSLSITSAGALAGGGSTRPTLTVNSGGTLNLPTTVSFSTIDITNNGTIGGTSLTVASTTFTNSGSMAMTSLVIGSGGNFIQTSTSNPFSGSDLTIDSGGTFTQNHTSAISVGTVTINSGGTLTHSDNGTSKTAMVNFISTTFTVNAGGIVTANGLGYDASSGPAAGQGSDAGTAGGAAHCGAGGNGSTPGAGGTSYDSSANPDDLGAGGGNDTGGGAGGAGGGQIKIAVSGTLTVDGTITANGAAGVANQAGGGAGGTVRIDAGTWAGAATGVITVNGGAGSPVGAGTTGGGGGGAGYIATYYGTKTYGGTTGATGGAKGGATSVATAGANCTPLEVANAPTITGVSHTPSPIANTTDPVTLSCGASYGTGLGKIELYLDGTTPSALVHTCTLSGSPTSASCTKSVGLLAYGSHTTTCKAYGTDLSVTTGSETYHVGGSTFGNGITLGRHKAGVTTTFSLTYTLQGTSQAPLVVTFPVGFTVNSAASSGSSCLSAFGFTSSTLTATTTNCTGTVIMSGASVTNPVTPGIYTITWTDDSGSGSVVITDDDQVTVSGDVEPQLTFNVGSQTAACDGTFSGSGGALGLGALTASAVASSDVSSVPHVCTRLTSNAGLGAVVSVRSSFGALQSASTPADQVASSTATLVAGTAGYGMCAGSSGGDSGRDATTPAGAVPSAAAPFNGSCTTSAHSVGGLTASFQTLWSVAGPSQNAFFRVFLKAAVSPATPAHADYQDVLTFIATGTY